MPDDTLYVDCSANGLPTQPSVPVFTDDRITLQIISMCQPVQSAALIGFAETLGVTSKWTTEQKNNLCIPIPQHETTEDFVKSVFLQLAHTQKWMNNKETSKFFSTCRLIQENHVPSLWTLL